MIDNMGLFKHVTNPYELVDENYKMQWELEEEKEKAQYVDECLDFDEIMQKYQLSYGDLVDILDPAGNWRYGSGAKYEIIGRLRKAIDEKEKDVYSIANQVRLRTATGNNKLNLKGVEQNGNKQQ